jgi:carboxymethylenebutenolidase
MRHQISHELASARCTLISRRHLLKSAVALTVSPWLLKSAGFAAALPSYASNQEPGVDAENIEYPSGDFKIQGYLAKSKTEGKHPAVILIHDDGGLNDHIRDVARRLAAPGFVVLAPDLLSRPGGIAKMKTPEEATETIHRLSVDATIQDLQSGLSWLRNNLHPNVSKISTVGFGWGGWRSFLLAENDPDLSRAVVFCGSTPADGLNNIEAAVLAHYAQFDFRITGNAIWTGQKMKAKNKQFSYYVYPQVRHGFYDDTSPEYSASAAKLAWTRTLDFLRAAA